MKRTGRLAVALFMAVLSLPGCGGRSATPAPPAPASARSAAPASARDLDKAVQEHDRKLATTKDTDPSLAKEEGHPFWNVVGATLGLVATVILVGAMLGGF